MRRFLIMIIAFISIFSFIAGCSKKPLTTQNVMYIKAYKTDENTVEDYKRRPVGNVYIGMEKKKVDSQLGEGYELDKEDQYLPVFYGNGMTVLFNDDKAAMFDYIIDETSVPDKRSLLFSIFREVNLFDKLNDIKDKLGEDYFTAQTNDAGTPIKLVYVYEFSKDTYVRQLIPNSASSQADQLEQLRGKDNTMVIVLYTDQLNRYQEIYRIQIGNLKDILEYRED